MPLWENEFLQTSHGVDSSKSFFYLRRGTQ
jgi:hypothetical protein